MLCSCTCSWLLDFMVLCFFFFNDTATTEIYTLSLHDALPILELLQRDVLPAGGAGDDDTRVAGDERSEEHTSELQSRPHLVCRLLLEKKKSAHESRKVLPATTRVHHSDTTRVALQPRRRSDQT